MVDSVIELNNVGVAYLEAGNNERARRYFKKALDEATTLLQPKQHVTAHSNQARNASPYIDFPSNGIHVPPNSSHVIDTMTFAPGWIPVSSKRLTNDVGSYVYSQALYLSKERCGDTFCHRESIVITFNLALVHHMSGRTLHTTKFLMLALRLYEMSLSLLRGFTGLEACYVHLALSNNMGQIHYELAEYDKAATCFSRLKELLASDAMAVLEPDVLSGFFMNVMFLDAPHNAAAA